MRAKIGLSGRSHPLFKGEWFARSGHGQLRAYVWIDEATRLRLNLKRPYMPRARKIWMEAHPDETLLSTDVIHHLNGDTLDDRSENLQKIPSQREHAALHDKVGEINAARTRLPDKPCESCGAPVRPWRRFCSTACTAKGLSGAGNPNAGKSWTPEERERAAAAKRGRQASPETRERMRQAHLKRWEERKAAQG